MIRRRPTRKWFSSKIEALELRVVPTTELISVNLSGTAAGDELSFGVPEFDNSRDPVRQMSGDGRFVLFSSNARDISASPIAFSGHLNQGNIYVRDRKTGTTTLVNASIDGQAYGDAADPSITPDGRFVVFVGAAYDGRFELSPLVAGITFPPNLTVAHQLYVRDLLTDTTSLVSVRTDGIGSAGNDDDTGFHASISADGGKVVFVGGANDDLVEGDHNHQADIMVRDMVTETTILISRNAAGTDGGNGASYFPTISADGTHVTFLSDATDLTNLPDTNNQPDLFSYSFADGTITLLSTNSTGTAAANAGVQTVFRVDDSGTKVAFLSRSTDLMDVHGLDFFDVNFFLRDLTTGDTTLISHGPTGEALGLPGMEIGLSRDGTTATFHGDGGFVSEAPEGVSRQIYLADTATGQISLASRSPDGSPANADSFRPTLNSDGRYVLFSSSASNLAPNFTLGQDTDGSTLTLFVFDRLTNTTLPVSVDSSGVTTRPTDGPFAGYYSISRDGTTMAFTTTQTGYGTVDDNGASDVYAITQTPLQPNHNPGILDEVFTLLENSPLNSSVGSMHASDPDIDDILQFSIIAGNEAGAFAINSTTGNITVANSAVLDFETTHTFNLTVRITDSHGAVETGTALIALTDVDEVLRLNHQGSDVTWTKTQPPVNVLPQITVTGAVALNGGNLTISFNTVKTRKKTFDSIYIPSSDELGNRFAPLHTNNRTTLQIQLGPNATLASVQALLRGITFTTKSKGVQIPTRSLDVTLVADGQTAAISQTIRVRRK